MGRGEGKKGDAPVAINDDNDDMDESKDHEEIDEDEAMLANFMGTNGKKGAGAKKPGEKKKTKAQLRRESKTLGNCCKDYKQSIIINVICFVCLMIDMWVISPKLNTLY